MPEPTAPAVVLWDFDGTLVDTEPIWAEIEAEMLAEHGVVWDDAMMRSVIGQHAEATTRQMAASIGQPERHREIHAELHDRVADRLRSGLPWLPGARELLDDVAGRGVPCAVVTASNGHIMDVALAQLPDSIAFVITADDVTETKPHPEGYLLAMQRFGVAPEDALVLEDSVPGATAGLAAGAVVYAVPSLAQLTPHPRLKVSTDGLRSTTWADLVEVWLTHRK